MIAEMLNNTLDFVLPPELEASEPPEARGLARDDVRLMVTRVADDSVTHTNFRDLPEFLRPGDVLVINTSGTLPAALHAHRADETPLELHLSTHLPADLWSVEARTFGKKGTAPFFDITPGEVIYLPGGAEATLFTPYNRQPNVPPRLWVATLRLPDRYIGNVPGYLTEYGFPIRYSYVKEQWPISYYQTVYATEPGSAEMPSAGRAFTPELITRLVARGIQIAPLILHTGVASLENHEPPYEEYYRVSPSTAHLINDARTHNRRVIAVGTTVIRTLETVSELDGTVHPGEGWTGVIVTPERGIHAVDALLTGLHEPRASHLAMLEALAGRKHLTVAYAEALRERYLWHEFGDLHLILPS